MIFEPTWTLATTASCLIIRSIGKSKVVVSDISTLCPESPLLPENSLFGLTLGVEANPGVHVSCLLLAFSADLRLLTAASVCILYQSLY